MKVLYVSRLFSGLAPSLASRRWAPSGAPTSFKLIEALDRSEHDLDLIFTARSGSGWDRRDDVILEIDGLVTPATVLAGVDRLPVRPPRVADDVSELRHLRRLLQRIERSRPDVIHIGHANAWAAAWLARRSSIPVLLRVMGVFPYMRDALTTGRPRARALRWAFRSPFGAVVMTQDGSGVEPWMDALPEDVPRVALVNGVTRAATPAEPLAVQLPPGATVVLLLGRLETYKGVHDFLTGFLDAWRLRPSLHALIVGDGTERAALERRVASQHAEGAVTFLGAVPHADVPSAHEVADIYVSLNVLGNLSNANLEAMVNGSCLVMPRSRPETSVDVFTDAVIPQDAAWRIGGSDDHGGLTDALVALHDDPARRSAMRAAVAEAAAGFVPTWDARIGREIEILERLAARERLDREATA